jgi:hypothetical protein
MQARMTVCNCCFQDNWGLWSQTPDIQPTNEDLFVGWRSGAGRFLTAIAYVAKS